MIFDRGDRILFIGDSISDYERARPVGEGLFVLAGLAGAYLIGKRRKEE